MIRERGEREREKNREQKWFSDANQSRKKKEEEKGGKIKFVLFLMV